MIESWVIDRLSPLKSELSSSLFLLSQASWRNVSSIYPGKNVLTLRHEAWERRKRLELRNLSLEPCG